MCCSVLQCVAVCGILSILGGVAGVARHNYVRHGWGRYATATHCNTLQRTATHCNAPQHTATRQVVRDPFFLDMDGYSSLGVTTGILDDDGYQSAAVGNSCVSALGVELDTSPFCLALLRRLLVHTTTHCNTLQYSAVHCNTCCNSHILDTSPSCLALLCRLWYQRKRDTLQHTATHCNTRRCCGACWYERERDTLQHTATQGAAAALAILQVSFIGLSFIGLSYTPFWRTSRISVDVDPRGIPQEIECRYGVATISRLLKIIGLFFRISSLV